MILPRSTSGAVLICGDASPLKRENGSAKNVLLSYENAADGTKANIVMKLPNFVQNVLHLEDRILDLLEIAAYVFAGDRRVSRGSSDALVFKAWLRKMHFVIRVRDFSFWNAKATKDVLSSALLFLTGDKSYKFTFQRGGRTFPTNIFDVPGFKLPSKPLTSVALFSGGLDSLAGALSILENQDSNVCLVSHRSGQTATQKTQSSLIDAISERFKGRVTPYNFECHLSSEPAADETQRSRSFLYTVIAFAVAAAQGLNTIHVFENGVTSINLRDRADMLNARASRTTHPKALSLIAKFLTLVNDAPFYIQTPFLWKTKTDITRVLKRCGGQDLLTSSISCGRTRDRKESSTHCGACSQCIDRRLAVWAAGLDQDDEAKLYAVDFNKEDGSQDRLLPTTLTDFIRQAAEFRSISREDFGLKRLAEISEIVPFLDGVTEEHAVTKLHDLCRRHGDDVWMGLRHIQQVFDDPLQPLKQGILPQMIRTRSYLDQSSHELQQLLHTLSNLRPGNDDAYAYEKTIQALLTLKQANSTG